MSTPSEFLKDLIGNPVVVKLNSGVDYRGILNCLDGYMNIALEQTEEYVNGQLKKKYGDAFIRGNNVLYISRQKRRAWILKSTHPLPSLRLSLCFLLTITWLGLHGNSLSIIEVEKENYSEKWT